MRAILVLAVVGALALADDPPKPDPKPGDSRPVEKALDDLGDILKTRTEKSSPSRGSWTRAAAWPTTARRC